MSIIAINKIHQTTVNKTYKHYRDYHAYVNLNDTFCTDKEQKLNESKQAKSYEKYECLFNDLPNREKINFERSHKKIHGYI